MNSLARIVTSMLRPIVRLCLKNGMRFQEISELVKLASVQAAEEELVRNNEPVNTSRLAALTGLQRRDVGRVQAQETPAPPAANLLSRILGKWECDREYMLRGGRTKQLTFEGNSSEFVALVKSVSADLNPYTVLFALEQSGAVRRSGNRVELLCGAYDVSKDVMEGMEIVALDADTLHRAVEANVSGTLEVPNLHLRTSYDNIRVEMLPQIREWLLEEGTALHERARKFLGKYDKDQSPRRGAEAAGAKVTMCAFSLVEEPNEQR